MKHFNSIFLINTLDEVTKFRLMNSFLVAIIIGVLGPAIITLKGTLMLPWVIAVFGILISLSVKSNRYITKLSISTVFRMSVIVNILLLLSTSLYFWNPLLMVYTDSIIMVIETAVMSAYSIQLNNYITERYPDSMHQFQILRNNIWADGGLIGLVLVTIVMYFFHITGAIYLFITVSSLFSIWLLTHWNFFKGRE